MWRDLFTARDCERGAAAFSHGEGSKEAVPAVSRRGATGRPTDAVPAVPEAGNALGGDENQQRNWRILRAIDLFSTRKYLSGGCWWRAVIPFWRPLFCPLLSQEPAGVTFVCLYSGVLKQRAIMPFNNDLFQYRRPYIARCFA